jgi:hypothetical protein
MDLAGLTSCRELTPEHADEAVRSLESLRLLIARLTEIGEPEDGAPKVLIVFARLARGDVPWLEGDVTVEIVGNDERTFVDVFKEEGWGIKERLLPQSRFRVPFDEFERAVEISAKRFAPLKVTTTSGKIVLTTAGAGATGAKPPAVELDDKSIGKTTPGALVAQEPEPFELAAPSEPQPFDAFGQSDPGLADATAEAETDADRGFGSFIDTNELDDPALAGAIVSPKKKVPEPPPTKPAPDPPPTKPAGTESAPGPAKPKADPVHSRPTVRRMVAIKPEALRTGRKDPRREDDD